MKNQTIPLQNRICTLLLAGAALWLSQCTASTAGNPEKITGPSARTNFDLTVTYHSNRIEPNETQERTFQVLNPTAAAEYPFSEEEKPFFVHWSSLPNGEGMKYEPGDFLWQTAVTPDLYANYSYSYEKMIITDFSQMLAVRKNKDENYFSANGGTDFTRMSDDQNNSEQAAYTYTVLPGKWYRTAVNQANPVVQMSEDGGANWKNIGESLVSPDSLQGTVLTSTGQEFLAILQRSTGISNWLKFGYRKQNETEFRWFSYQVGNTFEPFELVLSGQYACVRSLPSGTSKIQCLNLNKMIWTRFFSTRDRITSHCLMNGIQLAYQQSENLTIINLDNGAKLTYALPQQGTKLVCSAEHNTLIRFGATIMVYQLSQQNLQPISAYQPGPVALSDVAISPSGNLIVATRSTVGFVRSFDNGVHWETLQKAEQDSFLLTLLSPDTIPVTTAYNQGEVFPAPVPTRLGYIFRGWVELPGTQLRGNEPITMNRDITLQASWESVVQNAIKSAQRGLKF